MTVVEERIYGPLQPDTSTGVLYTAASDTVVVLKQIVLANTGSATATVTLGINGSDPADRIVPTVEMQGHSVYTLDVSQPLTAGETLDGFQGTSGAITVTIGAYIVDVSPVVSSPDFFELFISEPGELNVVSYSYFFREVEYDSTMAPWRFTVGLAPSGDSIIIDVTVNDVSVFVTPPEIPPGQTSILATPDFAALLAGDIIRVSIPQVGSIEPGGYLIGVSRYTDTS